MDLLLMLAPALMGAAIFVAVFLGREEIADWYQRIEDDFADKLRRLRIRTPKLRTYLIGWVGFVFFVYLVMFIIMDLAVLGLAFAVLMISLPWYIIRRMAQKRKEMIEDQLADAMVQLSSAIRAGLTLAQALEILSEQTPKPICQEFQQMAGEYRLGKPLERCLVEAKERLRSENFALFAAAMEASRESGGRLNETVERIAHSVRELQRLERKVQSETAQARKSAVYMGFAPLVILVLYYFFVDPVATERLFTTFWGQILLSIALVLNVLAYLWARKILAPDI